MVRKVEMDPADVPPEYDLGTVKGLSAIALRMRRTFLGGRHCPKDLGGFWDVLHETAGGNAFVNTWKGNSEAVRREELHQVHSLMRWVESGLPVFDLTHGLMSALLLTDPADVSADLVRAPFETFVVRLPADFWMMEDGILGRTPASLAVVHSFEADSSETHMLRPMISIRVVGRNGTTSTWEANELPPAGEPLGAWLGQDVADPVTEAEATSDGRRELVPPTENDRRLVLAFRRLYVNLCLYITEHGRGEPLGKRDGKGRPAGFTPFEPQPDVWVLGREVKLDRNLMDSAKAWTDSRSTREGSGAGWKLKEKFSVRGHWRNQAHGPKHSLRKLKWIPPYWKGEGPTFQHVYTTKERS